MRRTILPLLLICLLLSACGEQEARTPPGNGPLTSAAGLETDTVVATVDGREVAAGQYLYWLAVVCDEIQAYYQSAGIALNWSATLENGTLGDYAKSQALRSAALYATVEAWAERYGCALTEEDRASMETDWAEKSAAAGGEEAYLARLAEQGLDRAAAEKLAEDHYLYLHLCALAADEDSGLWAGEAELASFFRQQGYVTADILTFSGENGESRAAEAFAKLNGSQSLAADFAALRTAAGGPEDYPRTLLPADGTLPAELAAAAGALAEGQLSGIVETESGWAILLRLPDDTAAVRQDLLDQQLQAAADEARLQTTEAYETLDTAAFWAGLGREKTAMGNEET